MDRAETDALLSAARKEMSRRAEVTTRWLPSDDLPAVPVLLLEDELHPWPVITHRPCPTNPHTEENTMHSNTTPAGRRYHHHGDFSGDVKVVLDPEEVEHDTFAGRAFVVATIPMDDLRAIVAHADLNSAELSAE